MNKSILHSGVIYLYMKLCAVKAAGGQAREAEQRIASQQSAR